MRGRWNVLKYSAQYAVSLFCATFIRSFVPVRNIDVMNSITNVSTKYAAYCFRESTPAYMTSQQNLSQTLPRLKRNLSLAENFNGPGDPRPGLLLAWPG
jgi:hypothetical protein